MLSLRWLAFSCAVLVGCSAGSDTTTPNNPSDDDAGAGATGGAVGTGGAGGDPSIGGFNSSGGGDPCADPDSPDCDCEELSFNIDTKQSCSLDILDAFEMDGEGFITLEGMDHRVFALDRWGEGHIIAWCDGTTAGELTEAFDVYAYLGQVANPKVASFGDNALCQDGTINDFPGDVPYLGEDLPAQYVGDAAQLAADYDVIILCGFRIPWTTDWSSEFAEFVAVHGKGLLAVGEYEGVSQEADFNGLTNITSPSGIVFNPLNLAWAPSSTNVAIDCVPDLPPPD